MKTTDIKNWRYTLSYAEIATLDDFKDVLTEAIARDICLLCGGDKVSNDGLCIGCGMQLEGKDKEISRLVVNQVKVGVRVCFSRGLKNKLLTIKKIK